MSGEQPAAQDVHEDDLHAYVDGQLDPTRRSVVQAWLDTHPDDAQRVRSYVAQRAALRCRLQSVHDQPVPGRLAPSAIRARRRAGVRRSLMNAAAAVLLLLAGGAAGWFAHGSRTAPGGATLTADAASAHLTFVSEVRHPVEVAASQEAHLVQWLSNRLGRPLRVPDLSAQGFHLLGGRLLPGEDTPAAQFMYDDGGGTRLTLYLRADPGDAATSFQVIDRDGLSGLFWVDQGFGYAVFAQMSRARLEPVAEAVWRQLGAPGQQAAPH